MLADVFKIQAKLAALQSHEMEISVCPGFSRTRSKAGSESCEEGRVHRFQRVIASRSKSLSLIPG